MTLDAYVGLLGKLDAPAVDEASRNQAACVRMERELLMEEEMRVLPAGGDGAG